MATLASEIVTRVEQKLNDLGNVRWPLQEILDAINDCQNIVLEAKPDLFEFVGDVALQTGARQSVPADCYLLWDVEELKESGVFVSTPRRISKPVMDRQRPDWMGMAEDDKIYHWLQHEEERQNFFVNPPSAIANKTLTLRYAKRPTIITDAGDNLSIPDEHVNTMYYFCMMRNLEKDEKFSGSAQASRFSQLFAAAIGMREAGESKAYQKRQALEGG